MNGKKFSKTAVPSIFNIIGAVQNCSLKTVLNEYSYAVPAIQNLKKMYDENTSKGEKTPKSEVFPQSSKKKTRRKNSQSRICDCRNKRQVLFTRVNYKPSLQFSK